MLAVATSGLGVWGVQLWQLRGEVDGYGRYWSQPQGATGGILYVALGDSTAQGIGASRPDRGYVGLIAERLRTTTGRPVQVLNLSRSGARVLDVVHDQLPQLAGLRPDVVTVAVGANDIRTYEAARFRADIDALVAGLPADSVIGDVPWFMHGGAGRNSDAAAAYVASAAQTRDLRVAGLHGATLRRGWLGMLTDFAADWFHPRDRGYRVWADAFWRPIAGQGVLTSIAGRAPNSMKNPRLRGRARPASNRA